MSGNYLREDTPIWCESVFLPSGSARPCLRVGVSY